MYLNKMEMKRKIKRKKIKFIISFLLLIFVIFGLFSSYNYIKTNRVLIGNEHAKNQSKYILKSDIVEITEENKDDVIWEDNYAILVKIKDNNFENEKYEIEYGVEGNLTNSYISEKEENIKIKLENEGKTTIIVNIKKENEYISKWNQEIYYVKPYQKQYLDELEKIGFSAHFGYPWQPDDPEKTYFLKNLGVNYVRDDIRWNLIETSSGKYNYTKYDKWIDTLHDNNIQILGILGYPGDKLVGSDKKISSEAEMNKFLNFARDVIKRYDKKIMNYEFLNEPNTLLLTQDDMYWYSQTVINLSEIIQEINPDINLVIGATRTDGITTDSFKLSTDIFQDFYNTKIDNKADDFSIHIYDYRNKDINKTYLHFMNQHKELLNNNGGFQKLLVTEHGASTFTGQGGATEEKQASIIITQDIVNDLKNIDLDVNYVFRNLEVSASNPEEVAGYNFGILTTDYLPKKSYYAIKNYYENTNGSEHIGKLNITEGLEAHVFDKDGKPKIIAWSNNSDKNISIPYQNFTAKDIYGNDIQKGETSNLIITTSPVYLDNISRTYFYQAISNTMKEKFEEFNTKFTEEISKVSGLSEKLQAQKQIAEDIGTHNESSEIDEDVAINYMKDFYQVGDKIISQVRNNTLEIEDVKLSSILDSLNDIGNSYEDLVIITAKTREKATVDESAKRVEDVKVKIENNQDIEIVYPVKILNFAKDFSDKATYINGVEQENDIKTGLIVSKSLHSELLSNWAEQFVELNIDDYINNNPLTITYSTEDITNENVIATLNTNEDTQITSDNGSNEYTFEQNGTHDFHYIRRGIEGKITATVNNIDKEPPVIAGVEANKIYINKAVTPEVKDEHLEKVELYLNGEIVPDYQENTEISTAGKYKIIATDLAENTTEVNFEISNNENIYEDRKSKLIELYDNFNKTYTAQINNSLISELEKIRDSINNMNVYTKADTTIELLERTLNVGNKILENNNNENIQELLVGIGNICGGYEAIMQLNEEKIETDITELETKSKELDNLIEVNSDLNMEDTVDLIRLFKKYRNDIIYTENYVKKYYYIVAENLSNYINILINNKITQYIEANPITLSYSEDINKLTRNDITVTLNKGEDTKITCNNGSNIYTFNKNGSYVFSYERRGRKGKLEAKVENIDKDSPTIKGVVDGISYTSKRTPRVSDEHLDIVELYFNDEVVENYTVGSTLTEIGKYRIVATDLVGNVTAVDFEIREITDNELIETEYNVDNNFIKGVLPNTSYEQFIKKIETTSSYIIKRDGKELSINETKALATGDILEFPNVNKSYKLIVAGDINKDGNVNAKDLVRMRRYLLEQVKFDEIETCAADTNLDGKEITAKDLVRLRVMILNSK